MSSAPAAEIVCDGCSEDIAASWRSASFVCIILFSYASQRERVESVILIITYICSLRILLYCIKPYFPFSTIYLFPLSYVLGAGVLLPLTSRGVGCCFRQINHNMIPDSPLFRWLSTS
jgi:hypothetical protein